MSRLLDYAEPAVHVAILGLAVALSWMYWSSGSVWPTHSGPTVHVDSSKVLRRWRPTDTRIFLFISPTCPYCNRSMDFYARLGRAKDSLRQEDPPVSLAAVINRVVSLRAQRKILRDAGVSVDTLLVVSREDFRSVGATSVPTVAVESPTRERPRVWVGLQDSTGEQEILSAVQTLAGAR